MAVASNLLRAMEMGELFMTADPAIARAPADYDTFRISPSDTNYMALIADPVRDQVPFTALVEIFDVGGKTPPNTHAEAFEMFYVLSGTGVATCDGKTFAVSRGDSFVVRPRHEHVLENTGLDKLYCLTVMIPNEGFAELIRSGTAMSLDAADLGVLRGSQRSHETRLSSG